MTRPSRVLPAFLIILSLGAAQAEEGAASYPREPDWTAKMGRWDCMPIPRGTSDIDVRRRGRRTVQVPSPSGDGWSWLNRRQTRVLAESSHRHGDICTAGRRVRVNLWQG